MLKKILLLIFIIFISGCSTKYTTISVIKKPNEISNPHIRSLKVEVKEPLKTYIQNQMLKTNEILGKNYFTNSFDYSILKGDINLQNIHKFYTKNVNLYYNGDICTYKLYPCKASNNILFCKQTATISMNAEQFNKLSLYKNKDYVMYNNQIYKIQKLCKKTSTTIKCEYAKVNINADLKILYENKTIFNKNYYAQKVLDPCKNINKISPNSSKIYNISTSNEEIKKQLLQNIASKFIADIAPHKSYIFTKYYTDADIDGFEDIVEIPDIYQRIFELKKLLKKYPKNCVLNYDLGIFYTQIKNYNQAKYFLNKVCNLGCDECSDTYNVLGEIEYNVY